MIHGILDRINKAFYLEGKSKHIDDPRYQVTKDESKRRILIILLIAGVLLHLIFGITLFGVTSITSRLTLQSRAITYEGEFVSYLEAFHNLPHFDIVMG